MASFIFTALLAGFATAAPTNTNIPAGVPDFVVKHAPLVYLHSEDKYLPSDLATHLANTVPKIGLDNLPAGTNLPPLTLNNLDILNNYGKNGTNIFLTAKDDVSEDPAWILGTAPDANGVISNGRNGAIIVTEKDGGIVDAFYSYFFTFNWGGVVLGQNLGNHVGDFEHIMIRFVNGVPKFIWYSQHASGQAFKYDVVRKDPSSSRPIGYCAKGSHAFYGLDGVHDYTLQLPVHGATPGFINDWTDKGKVFDLTASAYWYKWTAPRMQGTKPASAPQPPVPSSSSASSVILQTSAPASPSSTAASSSNPPVQQLAARTITTFEKRDIDPASDPGTFAAYDSTHPVNWLYFKGLWGDMRYPNSDKRQKNLFGQFYKYEGGPTGPAWKELGRKNVWIGKNSVILEWLFP